MDSQIEEWVNSILWCEREAEKGKRLFKKNRKKCSYYGGKKVNDFDRCNHPNGIGVCVSHCHCGFNPHPLKEM